MVTYTLHITLYTCFSAVTHSPNHQRRTHSHHITHRHHLGNAMVTLGLRRPGEQVSTLTSGTCPPPGFPPNALRVTYTLNFLRGTFPWYSSTALYGSSVTLAQLHIYTFTVLHLVLHITLHLIHFLTHMNTSVFPNMVLQNFKSLTHSKHTDHAGFKQNPITLRSYARIITFHMKTHNFLFTDPNDLKF